MLPGASVARAVLSFLLPDSCLACGSRLEGRLSHLCPACRDGLSPTLAFAELPRSASSPTHPAREPARAAFALDFAGPARALVHALKYQGRAGAARVLGEAAGPTLARWAGEVDAIVPVPLHPVRRRERGFNQAELLANSLSAKFGAAVEPKWLRRKRLTSPQAALSREERLANVAAAFEALGPATGARVLLLDDVVTTGATLAAAAAELARAGAASVLCCAVAGRRLEEAQPAPRRPASAPETARHSREGR